MQVVFELYSGKPNPSFKLTDKQVADLARRLRLPLRRVVPPGAPIARPGFRVENPRREGNLPARLRVFRNLLEACEGSERSHHADHRDIYAWLKDLAREHGFTHAVDVLESQDRR